MSFFSIFFLLFLATLVLGFHATKSKPLRRAILSAANLLFLIPFVPNVMSGLVLVAYTALTYALVRLAVSRQSRALVPFGALFSVAFLMFAKRYDVLRLAVPDPVLQHGLELIGISYITFKFIHVLVDAHQNQTPPITLACYANYQFGFFSLVAGPIQRYEDFHAFWDRIDGGFATRIAGLQAFNRTLTGLIKLGVLAALALRASEWAVLDLQYDAWTSRDVIRDFVVLFYAYPIYVYLNFSGYCDVVIGAAGLLGMKHQENFDSPFLARNMLDFWNRWHISLTLWIRDYVFMTSYKWVAERWGAKAGKIGYLLLFVSLFLAGVWHGATWNFAVFGILHGIGVAVTQMYGDALRARLGRARYKAYMQHPWIRRAGVCVALHYACLTFLFFDMPVGETLDLVARVVAEIL